MAKKRKTTKKKTTKRKVTKRSSAKRRPRRKVTKPWWRRHPWWTLSLLVIAVFLLWVLSLDYRITRTFETRRWDLPARVYAAPSELYVGREVSADQLESQLRQLGYRSDAAAAVPGTYRRAGNRLRVHRRAARFWDGRESASLFEMRFSGGTIASIQNRDGATVSIARLDPLMIGSVFAAHGEDRLVLAPDEVPALLRDTLVLVEDRRFDNHFGIDIRAVVRAAIANIRAGRVTQGGSTLTQQLVKSYFLTNERSYSRKFREAIMSILLEIRFDKQDILTAYINEIYLGQDGGRAVHGFALASQFYFAKPLPELDAAEIAMLVAIVRGPSFYEPNRFAERVRDRRDRILQSMYDTGIVSESELARSLAKPIRVASRDAERANYHPAFVELVRRQLARDYAPDDLQKVGLQIHTTMDPMAQAAAQSALGQHIDRLRQEGAATKAVQGAVVVVDPRLGDIHALIGSRERVGSGFNRALDARRQIGSLIKPVVFLAALQSGDWHMGSVVEDEPLSIAGDDGALWAPQNFSGEFQGTMPLYRALVESVNVATVRLGLAVGVRAVADSLARLGGPVLQQPYPSLLLGAVEMAPIEVALVYMGLASDGLRPPLRAVREVVSADGGTVTRYPFEVDTIAGSDVLYQLQTALRQVMVRGTGRSAAKALPTLAMAGKTGTTNDFRDAWFAGFTGDRLAVVWVGNDDNSPTGLTGSRGALPVWTKLMASLSNSGMRLIPPQQSRQVLLHYPTGGETNDRCDDAVAIGVPINTTLKADRQCKSAPVAERALRWLKDTF